MKEPELSKGLQYIDEDLIAEAMEESEIKSVSLWKDWKRWVPVAAAIGVVIGVWGIYLFSTNGTYQIEAITGNDLKWKDFTYIDADIPMSEIEDGHITYNQISNVNSYNNDLYGVLNSMSMLGRDFTPIIKNANRLYFSRKTEGDDSDLVRYEEMVEYIGANGPSFCYQLLKVTEKYQASDHVGCLLIQNMNDKETIAVGLEPPLTRLVNCELQLIISKDFSQIKDEGIRTEIEELKTMDVEEVSVINNQKIFVKFICRQRNINDWGPEEEFVYYAYWEKDGMEYLLQFDTDYTSGSTSSEKQGHRRVAFEEILCAILEMTNQEITN